MNIFKRKKPEPEPDKAEKPEDSKGMVTLRQDDSPWERARKLFRLSGLRDGLGLSNHMAEGLEAYQKLDVNRGAQDSLEIVEAAMAEIESMEVIAADLKKRFFYCKSSGKWAWCDAGDEELDLNFQFDTRLDALKDATEPYRDDDDGA